MPYNFYALLQTNNTAYDMPAVSISLRSTDKYIAYHRATTRLDYISGIIYNDETMWRIIMWANPDYFIEYDIPEGAVIRVPFPFNDALSEVITLIQNNITK